jgi:membrane protein
MTFEAGIRRALGSFPVQLPHCAFQHFLSDRCLQLAAGLAFTSLLSIVPLMAVMIGVFAAFPVFDRVTIEIQDFVFQNFVPASGEVIQSHLQAFAEKSRGLTAVGTVVLVVTAVMLISAINAALDQIWKVRWRRSVVGQILVYWALLTLGPLLIGASLAVTSYLVSLPLFSDATPGGVRKGILDLMPWATSALGFTLMYAILPNTRVRIRHALIGAVVAAFLFEAAKHAFALYVTSFPTYQTIYGALATVPLFLIWIYVTWIIILLGAEFTYCAGRSGWGRTQTPAAEFLITLDLLRRLWLCQRRGEVLDVEGADGRSLGVSEAELGRLLEPLSAARIIHRVEGGAWALSRDLNDLTLLALYRALPYRLPSARDLSAAPGWVAPFADLLSAVESEWEPVLDRPLAEMLESSAAES